MTKNHARIALISTVFAILGVIVYRLQGSLHQPLMNPLGIVSFAAIGASVGCLFVKTDNDLGDSSGWL